ncbi:MAG: bifunctional diaminohydroxyphosphoribosylaminopyrimidine deaminase/5-amino-6-(5-phosphoribosylamino)uracil reductase RibD [bacterium]
MTSDEQFMAMALDLARRGEGRTAPNPAVGCVIVRDGEILGQGWHERAGMPHAEAAALASAGDVTGATAYVTLEPCSFHGRTPPCASALIRAGIKRVVVGTLDSNPKVNGAGLELLRDAGIQVDVGVLEQACFDLNRPFFKLVTTGRPWVLAKWAMTLDGKIATRTGHSEWVSGEVSRAHVHGLRNTLDAILVGAGTVRLDDPRLTCRVEAGRDPVRVLLDSQLSVAPTARIFDTAGTLVFCASTAPTTNYNALLKKGAQVIPVGRTDGKLDVVCVLNELGARGIASVLVEGGGAVLGSFFDAGMVDHVMAFVAPKIAGGLEAPGPVAGAGIVRMTDSHRLVNVTYRQSGEDLLIEGDVEGTCLPD